MADIVRFTGGSEGPWRITGIRPFRGEGIAPATRLRIGPDAPGIPHDAPGGAPGGAWSLRGFVSNLRYTTRTEMQALAAVQEGLGRPGATCAALIPIAKSPRWWAMAQDERRALFEEVSHHTAIGLAYLPGIARRLHHARDLGEPFDFLTWFEFAPEAEPAFDALLARLRATEEWNYVDREIDIRLSRES